MKTQTMNKRERQAEEQELAQAVRTLRTALRGMAQRKAARYEAEFLLRVRDMIDREISDDAYISSHMAEMVGKEVKEELLK